MKKTNLLWLPIVSLLIATPVITSCGDDDEKEIVNPTPSPSPEPTPGKEVLSPTEQKEYLEVAGIEFLDYVKAADFQNIVDLTEYVEENYIDEYDADEVENWYDACLRDITEVIGTSTEEDSWTIYEYTDYSRLYAVSNFTGHFVAKNGYWDYTSANDLQFTFNDKDGKSCTVKVVASGKTKTVYVGDEEDWDDYEYDYSIDKYIEYIDRYENRIAVPEKITLTLTQGSKKAIELVLTTDLNTVDGENFNLEKDRYNVSATLDVNGYKLTLDKVAYNAQSNASINMNLKKDGKVLLKMSASVDGKLNDEEITSAKNARLEFDLLDKVKIAGDCSDVIKFNEKLEKAEDYCDDEGRFKSYLNDANGLLNLNVYYGGTDVVQAYVELESFYEESYWGDNEWDYEPVICFKDGSKYSTFEVFFDEDDFKSIIKSFERLVEDFEDLTY